MSLPATTPPGITERLMRREWLTVGALFVLSVIAYVLIAGSRTAPLVANDEFIYGNIAQSLAAGDGYNWRGSPPGQHTLYPFVIAPAWLFLDGVRAYTVAKAIGMLLSCLAIWPAWRVSRSLISGPAALLPLVFLVLGAWMVDASKIMTEALAFPAAAAALCLMVLALQRESGRWLAAALALAVLAAAARAQLASVLIVLALAVTFDAARLGRAAWTARASERRVALIGLWAIVLIGVVVGAGPARSLLGDYGEIFSQIPPVWATLRWTLDHASDLALLVGVVPWVATLALIARRDAWREPLIGPYLCVLFAALIVLLLQAGAFTAVFAPRVIERYVIYLVPLLLVGTLPALRRVSPRTVLAVSGATALGLGLSHDPDKLGGEASSITGIGTRLFGWPSHLHHSLPWALAVVVLLVGSLTAGAIALRARDRPIRLAGRPRSRAAVAQAALLVLLAAWLISASDAEWRLQHHSAVLATAFWGGPPQGIDRTGNGDATLIATNVRPVYALLIEFFNKDIDHLIGVPAAGTSLEVSYGPGACAVRPAGDGRFAVGTRCGAAAQRFVFASSPPFIPTLRNGGPAQAQSNDLIYLTSGQPRIAATRTPICFASTGACQVGGITTFAERQATLTLRFSGGTVAHQIAVGQTVYDLPPGVPSTIDLQVARGPVATQLQPDWTADSADVPHYLSATLHEGGAPAIALN